MSKHLDQSDRPRWAWWTMIIGAPIAVVLGAIGYWSIHAPTASIKTFCDAVYCSLQLLIVRMADVPSVPWTLEVARWLALVVFSLATLVTLFRFFPRELRLLRLQIPWPTHVVILGLGPKTTQLVRCFRKQGRRVVVVAPSADADGVEHYCHPGITLMAGRLADPATLAKARIDRASHVIALATEDSTNMAIAYEARQLITQKARRQGEQHPVKCFIHLGDIDARASLQASHVYGGDPRCTIRYFDLFDAAARKLLEPKRMPLDRGGIRQDDPRQVHLVILGFGRMGQSVALRAAQLGHFANRQPLRISIIDQHAEQRKQALLFRYPNFEKTCRIEFNQLDMESLSVRQLLGRWCSDTTTAVSIAVCFDQDSLALEVALRMNAMLQATKVPMFVRMSSAAGFAAVLQGGTTAPAPQVHAFGMLEDCCCDDLLENKLNEDLAQAIHGDYRVEKVEAIRRKSGDPAQEVSVRTWDELDEGLKDSNRQQADHIDIKLHALGFERVDAADPRPAVERLGPDEIELLAEVEHNRWNAERWLQGWTLGPSDKPKKVTPYLVPWGDLPDDIKPFDRTTVSKIPDFLRVVGQKACRMS